MPKLSLKDYKDKAKWANDYAKRESERADRWMFYANDLADKLEEALERLQMISAGTYYADESTAFESSDLRAKKTASLGLKKIARMKERKP